MPVTAAKPLGLIRKGINHVVFSPDGRLMATADVNMNVLVRHEGEVLLSRNFESHNDKIRPTERIRGLRFSPDSSRLYVAAGDTLAAIDIVEHAEAWSYTPPRSWGFLIISPASLAVSAEGDVAAAFDNGSLAVWNSAGELLSLWQDNDAPRTLEFLAGSRTLIGTDSFSFCVWDVETRSKVWKQRLGSRAFGMAACPVAPLAVTRSLSDATVWDLNERTAVAKVPVKPGLPLVAFHPTAPIFALGSKHGVELYDHSGNLGQQHEIESTNVLSIAFSPQDDSLVVGCSDEEVRRFDVVLTSADR